MTTALLIAGAVIAGVLALLIGLSALTRAVYAQTRALIPKHHAPESIVLADERALSFGLESKGPLQLRGNGALVLTRRELHFIPLSANAEVRIPLESIKRASTVRAHLGKTIGRKLLRVDYDDEGRAEAIALFVQDVESWLRHLAEPPGAVA